VVRLREGGYPYYFVVDRDPRIARATLYGSRTRVPEPPKTLAAWSFGGEIILPEPFVV
jgi:hypothetical protein